MSEMTEAELCSLDPAGVERAYLARCARDGVPLTTPVLPEAPVAPTVEPDVLAFEVLGVPFVDRAVAEKVAQLASSTAVVDVDYHQYKETGLLKYIAKGTKLDNHDVTVKRYVSQARKNELAHAIAIFERDNERYHTVLTEHNVTSRKQTEARHEVDEAIATARNAESVRVHWNAQIDTYLEVADGDGTIRAPVLRACVPQDPRRDARAGVALRDRRGGPEAAALTEFVYTPLPERRK